MKEIGANLARIEVIVMLHLFIYMIDIKKGQFHPCRFCLISVVLILEDNNRLVCKLP